jgi:hypothetical protein
MLLSESFMPVLIFNIPPINISHNNHYATAATRGYSSSTKRQTFENRQKRFYMGIFNTVFSYSEDFQCIHQEQLFFFQLLKLQKNVDDAEQICEGVKSVVT